jgi:hypothetical protein
MMSAPESESTSSKVSSYFLVDFLSLSLSLSFFFSVSLNVNIISHFPSAFFVHFLLLLLLDRKVPVRSIEYSADSSLLFAAADDKHIHAYDTSLLLFFCIPSHTLIEGPTCLQSLFSLVTLRGF